MEKVRIQFFFFYFDFIIIKVNFKITNETKVIAFVSSPWGRPVVYYLPITVFPCNIIVINPIVVIAGSAERLQNDGGSVESDRQKHIVLSPGRERTVGHIRRDVSGHVSTGRIHYSTG